MWQFVRGTAVLLFFYLFVSHGAYLGPWQWHIDPLYWHVCVYEVGACRWLCLVLLGHVPFTCASP